MKRRSNVVPIRPSELVEYRIAESAAEKKVVVPRQLDFNGNSSRRSFLGKPPNFRAAENVPHRPRFSVSSRVSLSGRPRNDVSVMDGISLLGQTINESSDDVTIQPPKPAASTSSVPFRPSCASQLVKKSDVSRPSVPSKGDISISNQTVINTSSNQSLSSISETKIPKPKIRTTEKITRASSELNTTAAFEEEEIAALTSTPHPDRKSKSIVPLLSNRDVNSELAEQLKLFVMDQRSLMQAVKLSCHKTTSAMDQMGSVMGQMSLVMSQMSVLMDKLNLKVDSQTELQLVKKSEPLQNNIDNIGLIDDKENVDVQVQNQLKPFSMFSNMKSQLNCLKTPTTIRTRPLSAETPNTILSNTVHSQLENLYETSETE